MIDGRRTANKNTLLGWAIVAQVTVAMRFAAWLLSSRPCLYVAPSCCSRRRTPSRITVCGVSCLVHERCAPRCYWTDGRNKSAARARESHGFCIHREDSALRRTIPGLVVEDVESLVRQAAAGVSGGRLANGARSREERTPSASEGRMSRSEKIGSPLPTCEPFCGPWSPMSQSTYFRLECPEDVSWPLNATRPRPVELEHPPNHQTDLDGHGPSQAKIKQRDVPRGPLEVLNADRFEAPLRGGRAEL